LLKTAYFHGTFAASTLEGHSTKETHLNFLKKSLSFFFLFSSNETKGILFLWTSMWSMWNKI